MHAFWNENKGDIIQCNRGHQWSSGSALVYWPTGRAIDFAPEASFKTKFISFDQVVPGPV